MNHGYNYPSSYNNHIEQQNGLPSDTNLQMGSNFGTNQVTHNSSIAQLLQEMQEMKATINKLTLTNIKLTNARNTPQPRNTQQLRGSSK